MAKYTATIDEDTRQRTGRPAAGQPRLRPEVRRHLLGFGTVSHLNAMSRRVAGIPATGLGAMAPMAVVGAFRRVGMRSRE